MSKKKKEKKPTPAPKAQLGDEIWGIIFMAVGFLVFSSLISSLIHGHDNILGPLGRRMAAGLFTLFGTVPSFIVPSGILLIGVSLFRGTALYLKTFVIWTIITIEICVLFAIHHLPVITTLDTFSRNLIGHIITYGLHYVFGRHTFGPYFLFGFALLITLAVSFNIDVKATLKWIGAYAALFFRNIFDHLKNFGLKIGSAFNRDPEEKKKIAPPPIKEKASKIEITNTDKQVEVEKAQHTQEQPAGEEPSLEPSTENLEEVGKKILEEQLAQFRAKRNAPIKITTMDEDGIDEIDEEDEEEDMGTEQAALLDPEMMSGDYEEFCRVAPEQQEKPSRPPKIYKVPSPRVIPDPPSLSSYIDREMIERNSQTLEKTLLNFGVEGKVINVSPGPIVTRYEIELAPGVKISKVVNLHDDLSMAVGGKKIRIQAPIPGKAAVGIELPNDEMEVVFFKHILDSEIFKKTKAEIPVIIGKNISGAPYVTNVRKMPHLLIAGQTGSGKSVCINSLICSLLMTRKPDELRLILIDPKKVELSIYEGIPHLMAPVVTESKEAVKALQWGVMEMTRRYRMLAKVHARNIDSFNKKIEEKSIKPGVLSEQDNKPLPFIVILVDELADLMMTASKDVEGLIQRIAQLARAVGIHLIVATQRPSVDIITGPIKANLTSRIAFRTIQSTDSRTILGHVGAEKLLGRGDMLFLRNGAPEIERFHGAFISEEDVEKIVESIKAQEVEVEKIDSFEEVMNDSPDAASVGDEGSSGGDDRDERFEEAARLIVSIGQGSTSLLQRRLKLGYARAGRIMDDLHNAGIVGPQEGSKMRDVLIRPEELEAYLAQLAP